MITNENWTYCHFKNLKLKAFISLGAEPNDENEIQELFFVTVTDFDDKELFQSEHYSLEEAMGALNSRYDSWEFVDATNGQSGDGCSSCSAH